MSIYNLSSNGSKVIDTIVDTQDMNSKDGSPLGKWSQGGPSPIAAPNGKNIQIGTFSIIVNGQILAVVANPA